MDIPDVRAGIRRRLSLRAIAGRASARRVCLKLGAVETGATGPTGNRMATPPAIVAGSGRPEQQVIRSDPTTTASQYAGVCHGGVSCC